LRGFLGKRVCKLWCFDGEIVVNCVVNVVFWHHVFPPRKFSTFWNYFFNRRKLTQGLHQFVDGAVEVFVGAALLVDLGDRVHHGGVVLASELAADLG